MQKKDKGISHFIQRLEHAEKHYASASELSALANKLAWYAKFRIIPKNETDMYADRITVLFERNM